MARKRKDKADGLKAPSGGLSTRKPTQKNLPVFPGYRAQKADEFERHAAEVKAQQRGRSSVDSATEDREHRPAPFDRKELMAVRSWILTRPLEPTSPAAALVRYPRLWTTKRGRYARFRVPGAGIYALLRARPTF